MYLWFLLSMLCLTAASQRLSVRWNGALRQSIDKRNHKHILFEFLLNVFMSFRVSMHKLSQFPTVVTSTIVNVSIPSYSWYYKVSRIGRQSHSALQQQTVILQSACHHAHDSLHGNPDSSDLEGGVSSQLKQGP